MKEKTIVCLILAVLFLVTVFLTSTFLGAAYSSGISEFSENQPNIDWWPMFHHDLMHTNNSGSEAPNTNQILWKFNTGGNVDSPIVADGIVSVGSYDPPVYAFGPSLDQQTYSVIFTQSGLRSGITWTVALNSQYFSSYSNSIIIKLPNGVYVFSIPEVGGWPTGYTASPSSGSVIVKGENITVQVIFNPTTLKFPSLIELSLFITTTLLAGVVIVLVVRIAGERAYRWRKNIRYLRWASKTAFLLLFIVPIVYMVGVPWRPVYSLLLGIHVGKPYLIVPITQSVCILWTTCYMNNINPGAWLVCPLGSLQTLLTGMVDEMRVVPTIIAMLVFIIPIILLGNVFCSWACPIGTMVDSFDKAIEKFFPKIEAKRNKRSIQSKQTKNNKPNHFLCPACPISRAISNRNRGLAYGILGSAVVVSFALKINVFCSVCPIGIISRGMLHLKSLSMWLPTARVTGQYLAIVPEMAAIPVAAVLVSIRERRFWCRKLCPVGGLLSGLGSLNPFIKPKVKQHKCIMKGCPDECELYHTDYCGICFLQDDRKCEKVCPVGINLVDPGSLHKCTKCMECYISCDWNAVKIDSVGKPDVSRIGSFFKRLRARR